MPSAQLGALEDGVPASSEPNASRHYQYQGDRKCYAFSESSVGLAGANGYRQQCGAFEDGEQNASDRGRHASSVPQAGSPYTIRACGYLVQDFASGRFSSTSSSRA